MEVKEILEKLKEADSKTRDNLLYVIANEITAEELGRFLPQVFNRAGINREKSYKAFDREHRYLQGEVASYCIGLLEHMGEMLDKGMYDGRNEYYCNFGKLVKLAHDNPDRVNKDPENKSYILTQVVIKDGQIAFSTYKFPTFEAARNQFYKLKLITRDAKSKQRAQYEEEDYLDEWRIRRMSSLLKDTVVLKISAH